MLPALKNKATENPVIIIEGESEEDSAVYIMLGKAVHEYDQ